MRTEERTPTHDRNGLPVRDPDFPAGFWDRHKRPLHQGDRVKFYAARRTKMKATVMATGILGRMVEIMIDGDPFTTNVDHRQLCKLKETSDTMTTTTAPGPTTKELRREAKTLGIDGWEEMNRDELAAAVKGSKKAAKAEKVPEKAAKATKTAKATKATAKPEKATKPVKATKKAKAELPGDIGSNSKKKAKPAKAEKSTKAAKADKRKAPKAPAERTGPNPFRAGTNLWHVAEALMKGGKRSDLVKELLPKMSYAPRKKSAKDFDKVAETDRRLKVIGYILRDQHGFSYEHEGRGTEAFIKVTPP